MDRSVYFVDRTFAVATDTFEMEIGREEKKKVKVQGKEKFARVRSCSCVSSCVLFSRQKILKTSPSNCQVEMYLQRLDDEFQEEVKRRVSIGGNRVNEEGILGEELD